MRQSHFDKQLSPLRASPAKALPLMVIMGIDPGLNQTGWGVVEMEGGRVSHIASGTIKVKPRNRLAHKLLEIESGLGEHLSRFRPTHIAIEKAFMGASVSSAFLLGSARAACLIASARYGLEPSEYAPTLIKKTIAGAGRADKKRMSQMVKHYLPQASPNSEHAADALAIALVDGFQHVFAEKITATTLSTSSAQAPKASNPKQAVL